jgi:hypothetical protein
MSAVRFKVDAREFTATLRKYAELSRREPSDIVNKKALYIARGALRLTPKADKQVIKTELGRVIRRKTGARTLVLTKARDYPFSLAEAIIRARIYRKGGTQPTAGEIGEKIEALINSRMRSIAFLKSGWIPAIKLLGPLVKNLRGAPPLDRSAKEFGTPKGSAKAATPSTWKVRATLENAAAGEHGEHKDALLRLGGPALQQAFDNEERSMKEYIEERFRENAKQSGIKTN